MRFFLFTDLHQNLEQLDKLVAAYKKSDSEFVVCLGDVTNFGTSEQACEILGKFNAKVYSIPGNCDPLDFPDKIGKAAVNMHCRSEEVDGYDLVGIGGSNITIFNTAFELQEDELYDGLKGNSKNGMILMTHVPSYGILDEIPSGLNVGSPAVKRIVDEYHPILAMSGHIHEAIGTKEIDGTVFVNPGPAKDGYYAIIDVENGNVNVELRKITDNL